MLPHDRRLREAVREDALAIGDCVGVSEDGEDTPPSDLEQELVACCHRVEERGELQILRQRVVACGRRSGCGVTVALVGTSDGGDPRQLRSHHRFEDVVAQLRLDIEVSVSMKRNTFIATTRAISRS